MESGLNQHYEDNVRPCIDLIDSLRALGVERDLALPAIAVIGDQSSGKSSVLEALSGVALPRGSGIVTRCPLALNMKRIDEGEAWHGTISYKDYVEEIDDPSDVEQKIREAQDKITGAGVGISDDLIRLEIVSPHVPDLTLIDLPGIARVAVEGQPENIGEQIKKLIHKFITKQETISLVVVPCNVDIATTEALKMAQEVDPEGERTLGVLTKPDLVDKGTEDSVVEILHNKVVPLKKGYMIVKCRGQKDILEKISLIEATEREKAFLEEHEHFSTFYSDGQASVPKLAEKLSLELVNHIKKSLPRLEEQINTKITETKKDLGACGTGPPSDQSERLFFLIDKVTAFNHDAISLTTGENLKCGVQINMFSKLRVQFGKWKDHLDCSKQNFNKMMDEYESTYRGRELPGFINYKTFEIMVQEQIKLLEERAVESLKEISDIVRKDFIQLAQSSFVGFPNLVKATETKIEAIRNEKESESEKLLRTQFKVELMVYTQDSTYKKISWPQRQVELSKILQSNKNSQYYKETRTEMMHHLECYYQIANQRLADQVPLVICYLMLQESAAQLQRDMLLMLQDKEEIEFLLHEDSGVNVKRTNLQNRLERLTKARAYLSRVLTFGFVS